jgi:hypothetical protein
VLGLATYERETNHVRQVDNGGVPDVKAGARGGGSTQTEKRTRGIETLHNHVNYTHIDTVCVSIDPCVFYT